MPEPAIAHDGDRPLGHHRCHARRTRETHAVTENRIAEREWLECRKGMTADVGGNMHRPNFALHQFQCREHGTLRTTDTKRRWPLRQLNTERLLSVATSRVECRRPAFCAAQRHTRLAFFE